MLRIIIDIVFALAIAVFGTLAIVNWRQTHALDAQVAATRKSSREIQTQLAELKETTAKLEKGGGSHGPQQQAHWGYEGEMNPARWGDAFPTCSTGRSQSPVDIRGPFDKATQKLKVEYNPMPLKVLNNGHTLQVNADPGNRLVIDGEAFDLLQFHFHRPSEERLDGKPAAMVAHFVHKNAAGKLVVLGVLLAEGRENAVVRSIWSNAPRAESAEVVIPGVAISPALMIPGKLDYFSYEGSLTTPPCTEGVTFYILKSPGSLSREQVEAFPFKLNARPVQPLNGRRISAS
jgi:carbonic anhydrase